MKTGTINHISLHRTASRLGALLLLSVSLSACNSLDRVSHIGAPPNHTPIANPVEAADYRPVTTPLPQARAEDYVSQPNSLWRPGSRAFFRDQRAANVGDILTVNIVISDNAHLKNETTSSRNTTESTQLPNIFGLEKTVLGKVLPGGFNPATAASINSKPSYDGAGEIKRNEDISLKVAALITQKLPNGNLVIKGGQEVLVNNEMRQLNIDGIIRPEDIASDNTIANEKIADARISYGGKGQVSDVQQARYGEQLLDVLSPF